MAGIDLMGDIVGSTTNNDILHDSTTNHNDKDGGLASHSANKYSKIQKVDANEDSEGGGGGTKRTNVQGYNNTTEIVVIKNGNNNSTSHSNNNSNSNSNDDDDDISLAFKDEDDPSKYMGIYEQIKHETKGISKNTDRIEALGIDYESVDKTSEYKVIMKNLDLIITNNRQITMKIKNMLTLSKNENDRLLSLKENRGSSMIQWRVNQLNTCIKQFKSTNMLFESSLRTFNHTMKETQKRQIRIVNTDDSLYRPISTTANGTSIQPRRLNDSEIDELLEDPQAATQFLNKALQLQDVSDVLMDRLSELEIRHEGMLRIEESIQELHQLWHELNILITDQQDMLDNIENNVIQTKEYVEKGGKHLVKAEKHQKMSRKLTACLFCFVLIVAIMVIGYFFGGF